MTSNVEQLKKSKKFAVGGDLPPSPTTSTGSTITATAAPTATTSSSKRPTRHHVKRRSSSRVHVTKLAPMARAHSNNGDIEDGGERKPIKRSQSNKSLSRLPSFERSKSNGGVTGFTATAVPAADTTSDEAIVTEELRQDVMSPNSPPTTPPPILTTTTNNNLIGTAIPHNSNKNSFIVSPKKAAAAPIEQALSVTADNLVAPHSTIKGTSQSILNLQKKKSLLKSQFVVPRDSKPALVPTPTSTLAAAPAPASTTISNLASKQSFDGITRTQQKLLLQREQTLGHDQNNIAHPKNMIRLTREMERIGKEYRCVRKYQDPMMNSLIRCEQKKRPILNRNSVTSINVQQQQQPHMEQRQQILLKAAAYQHQQNQQNQQYLVEDNMHDNKWSPSHFLERLFYGS